MLSNCDTYLASKALFSHGLIQINKQKTNVAHSWELWEKCLFCDASRYACSHNDKIQWIISFITDEARIILLLKIANDSSTVEVGLCFCTAIHFNLWNFTACVSRCMFEIDLRALNILFPYLFSTFPCSSSFSARVSGWRANNGANEQKS